MSLTDSNKKKNYSNKTDSNIKVAKTYKKNLNIKKGLVWSLSPRISYPETCKPGQQGIIAGKDCRWTLPGTA